MTCTCVHTALLVILLQLTHSPTLSAGDIFDSGATGDITRQINLMWSTFGRGEKVRLTPFGNEPGWYLEIQAGKQLLFVGDYGMQRVMIPDPGEQEVDDSLVYQAAGNGNEILVEISPESCSDTIKGDSFPASVLLLVNGVEYRGCGMALDHPWQ